VIGAAIAVLLSTGVATIGAISPAAAAGPQLSLVHTKVVQIASGLSSPVALAWRGSDSSRIYVAEQSGRVVIVANGQIVSSVLTLSVSSGGERGLLGLTFSLDGTKLYVDYTNAVGDILVVEYTMNGNVANVATRRPLLLISHHTYSNHNGGNLVMGSGGNLYISTGDGGGAGDPLNNGQNLGTRLGKILRIDPRPSANLPYTIPPTNPFVKRAGVRPEIYMWGLRNPWKFSIDRGTRDMWIGDVGQALWEEVDYAPAGQSGINWGWNRREGFAPYNGGTKPPGARDPILVRSHSAGDCAIIGGFVYRGTAISSFNGAYVFGDECTGELRAVVQQNGVVTQSKDLVTNVPQITTFGEGPAGELYAASLNGTLYKLAQA
jgi:glucose/arabinose dehydrogenase